MDGKRVLKVAVTIKQIAELSGVSRGTVDRVLNGRGKVRPEVERRVQETAERLGYRPNKIGKALAYQNKPLLLGVVANGEGNSFFDEVIRGANTAGEEFADFSLRILVRLSGGYDVREQLELLDQMEAQGAQGVAIAPINHPDIAARLRELIIRGIPVVTFNSDIPNVDRLCFVGCDYLKSGRTAAGMMGKLLTVPTKVAVVTGSLQMLGHSQRVEGFRRQLEEAYPHLQIAEIVENKDKDSLSHRAVAGLLERHRTLQGIFFGAAGVQGGIRALREREMEHRLAVITCDDTPEIRELVEEGIVDATICQQPYQQGYQSVKILFDRLVGKVVPEESCFYTENQIKICENL